LDPVSVEVLRDKWRGICLDENALNEMLKLGGFTENVDWLRFIAIAAGHLTNVSYVKPSGSLLFTRRVSNYSTF
jgi:hypothetical protein